MHEKIWMLDTLGAQTNKMPEVTFSDQRNLFINAKAHTHTHLIARTFHDIPNGFFRWTCIIICRKKHIWQIQTHLIRLLKLFEPIYPLLGIVCFVYALWHTRTHSRTHACTQAHTHAHTHVKHKYTHAHITHTTHTTHTHMCVSVIYILISSSKCVNYNLALSDSSVYAQCICSVCVRVRTRAPVQACTRSCSLVHSKCVRACVGSVVEE